MFLLRLASIFHLACFQITCFNGFLYRFPPLIRLGFEDQLKSTGVSGVKRWAESEFDDRIHSTDEMYDLKNRLSLADRFGRWRYLQKILDGGASPRDAASIVIIVLERYIGNKNLQCATESSESMKSSIKDFIMNKEDSLKQLKSILDPISFDIEWSPSARNVIQENLTKLLPDPLEDEDAIKGLWDTIIELHGREAVKIDEKHGAEGWRSKSIITQILIYFDFLSEGI
jgi:hypothetical protein